MREAAEEIRKLRGELQTVHAHLQHYRNLRTADQSEIARLQADNKRLKGLLENSEMTVAEVIDANERLRVALLHVRGYIDGMKGMWSLEPGVKMIDDALATPPQQEMREK
jgi:DNA repair exonuclease SbcCD ATPase subunit